MTGHEGESNQAYFAPVCLAATLLVEQITGLTVNGSAPNSFRTIFSANRDSTQADGDCGHETRRAVALLCVPFGVMIMMAISMTLMIRSQEQGGCQPCDA